MAVNHDLAGNRPTINFIISGILVTALVDIGATCSLLRSDVFSLVVNRTHRSNVLHKTVPLKGLGGVSLQVDGRLQIQVAIDKVPLDVVICRNIPHEMILVNDSLRVGNGVIDLNANVLSWFRKQWPLRSHSSPGYDSVGPIFPETGSCAIDALVHDNADVFAAKGEKNGCYNTDKLHIKTAGPSYLSKSLQNAFD